MKKISIIVAVDENGTIGCEGVIPWHLPEDFKRFKEITMGHPVIMGRKTIESLPHGALPGRTNIVITKESDYKKRDVLAARSLEIALQLAVDEKEVFIIGGEQIYKLALPITDTIYLTKVHNSFAGDSFFPEINDNEWILESSELHKMDEKNSIDFSYLIYQRKPIQ